MKRKNQKYLTKNSNFRALMLFFIMFMVIGTAVYVSCVDGLTGEDKNGTTNLTFSITGLDESGLLEIESGKYVDITYTSNAKNPVITFVVDPPAGGLLVYGSAHTEHAMKAYASASAEGNVFAVKATLTEGSRSAIFDFAIFVEEGDVGGDQLGLTMILNNGNFHDINYTKRWDINYTIDPPVLQDDVVVTYVIISPPGSTALELFGSDHPDFPNTVRPRENVTTRTNFTVRATAAHPGWASRSVNIIIRNEPFVALTSITAPNMNIPSDTTVNISYTINPASRQSAALVSFSSTSDKLSFENNTVTTAEDAEGTFTVTMTAVLTDDPDHPVEGTFDIIIRESTKNYENRGGQSQQQIAALYGNEALGTAWHVPAIDNINTFDEEYLANYIIGVDIGSLIEVEEAGGKFYDVDGFEVEDVLELLAEYGINYVRLRIWDNPYRITEGADGPIGAAFGGGTNDLEKTIALAQRAKKWGMGIKLNFHYSDFWCHPGQQPRPRAWGTGNAATIGPILKAYTKDVLNAMADAGVLPDIVQVGNENNTGVAGFTSNADMNVMFRNGIEAVREVSQERGKHMRVMLHATNGIGPVRTFFNARDGLDYDILAMSYYPMWHGNRAAYQAGLQDFITRYPGKEIVVAEYSSGYTTRGHTWLEDKSSSNANQRSFQSAGTSERSIAGQAQIIRNMNSDIMNYTWDASRNRRMGIGSFWWEPAWLPLEGAPWARNTSREWYVWQATAPGGSSGDFDQPKIQPPQSTWGNQGFFTYEGTVIPSANAFLQMMGRPPRTYTSPGN